MKASKLEWGEALNGGACTDSDTQRSGGGFNVSWFSSFYSFEFPFENKTQLSTANRVEASPESSRLGTDCIVSKLTRMSRVRALSGYGRRISA
jgi:hypothetical protein